MVCHLDRILDPKASIIIDVELENNNASIMVSNPDTSLESNADETFDGELENNAGYVFYIDHD